MDPYEILGLNKEDNPTDADIKRAYRAAARKSHPDVSNDPVAFRRVSEAYQLLKDPERRKRYDATGQDFTAEDMPDGLKIIGEVFESVIANEMPINTDFVEIIRDIISSTVKEVHAQRKSSEKQIKRMKKLMARIKGKGEHGDFFKNIMLIKTANCELDIAKCNSAERGMKEALKLLKNFSFEKIPDPEDDEDLAQAKDTLKSWFENVARMV